jgi:hypothetical protein
MMQNNNVQEKSNNPGFNAAYRLSAALLLLLLFLGPCMAIQDNKRIGDEQVAQLEWWNSQSVLRVWGCDECRPGDLACSLGSSIAQELGIPCGYYGKRADYYGYEDRDDLKVMENPLYQWADGIYDTKYDYESGIPDFAIVEKSVKSIKTNISGYFVRESRWKGPPFWLSKYYTEPDGTGFDWQEWIIPCNADSEVQFLCKWWDCKHYETTSLPCNCPGITCGSTTDPLGNVCSCCTCPEGCTTKRWVSYWPDTTPCEKGWPNDNDNWKGWDCRPVTIATGLEANKDSYCDIGGAEVLAETSNSIAQNYTDYPRDREATGYDCNDDLPVFPEPFTAGKYPGKMPGWLPTPLSDQDMVRDRYWKRNATELWFICSRYGYCRNEAVKTDCDEATLERDKPYDRPPSRQHDPCRMCAPILNDGSYWDDCFDGTTKLNPKIEPSPPCPVECYTYDLRYYRQFNLDSVWANVFKINPEVNYPFIALPPQDAPPDVKSRTLVKIPGKYKCSLRDKGDPCTSSESCIDGLTCIGSFLDDTVNKHCCPPGTYYSMGCCRQEGSYTCSDLEYDCPMNSRIKVTNSYWGELETGRFVGWWLENIYGFRRTEKYLLGINEKGCKSDMDCASYPSCSFNNQCSPFRDPNNLNNVVVQHCSKAEQSTPGATV